MRIVVMLPAGKDVLPHHQALLLATSARCVEDGKAFYSTCLEDPLGGKMGTARRQARGD